MVLRYRPQRQTEHAVTKRSHSRENVRLPNLTEPSNTPTMSANRPPALPNTRTPPECQLLRSPTSRNTNTPGRMSEVTHPTLQNTRTSPECQLSRLPASRNKHSDTPRMSEIRSPTSLHVPEPAECQPPNPRYYKTLQRPQNISCQTVHPIKYSSTPRMSATRSLALQNIQTPPECPSSFYRTPKHSHQIPVITPHEYQLSDCLPHKILQYAQNVSHQIPDFL